MRRGVHVAHAPLLAAIALAAGCAAVHADSDAHEDALRPVERKIVGAAKGYDADPALRGQIRALDGSMKARRAAAWKAVAKALRPVAVAEPGVKVEGVDAKIPLFRTWYGKDDFERMFGKLYGELAPAERKERRPFSSDELRAAFAWNATDQGSWTDDDYLARVAKVTDRAFLDGLGGNSRVSYSPGFARHMLGDYKSVNGCRPRLAGIDPSALPASEDNFAPCFTAEFPIDAAMVKASWWRADFGMTLPVYDTGAATLAAKRSGASDQGGWGKGIAQATPDERAIYTVKTSDGSTYRMPGLHLATKELREWLWITLWWSPDADSDFGADRPREIRDLGGPWAGYKMCVVTGYAENDPDPRGGYDGSLGDALAAVHDGAGGPTWCSNPYVERGAKNAQTSCIGCHQHAGDPTLNSEAVLADEARFPKSGRVKTRKNFPADYVWAFDAAPELLAGIVERRVAHFDAVDR